MILFALSCDQVPSPVIWCAISVGIRNLFLKNLDMIDLEAQYDDDEDKTGINMINYGNFINEH